MSKGLTALVAGVLAINLIVVGCGGGDDATTTAPITKAEFIKRANAICKRNHQRIQSGFAAYVRGLNGNAPKNAAAAAAGEIEIAKTIIIPAKREEAEEFDALGAPPGDEDRVSAMVVAFEEGAERAERQPQRAVKDGTEAFGKSDRLTREYGLSC